MTEMNGQQFGLCDIQGSLFELVLKNGYDCKEFIERFMNSKTAAASDETYDLLQWAGEEYILEELNEEIGGLPKIITKLCIGRVIPTAIGGTILAKAVNRFIKPPPSKP